VAQRGRAVIYLYRFVSVLEYNQAFIGDTFGKT